MPMIMEETIYKFGKEISFNQEAGAGGKGDITLQCQHSYPSSRAWLVRIKSNEGGILYCGVPVNESAAWVQGMRDVTREGEMMTLIKKTAWLYTN